MKFGYKKEEPSDSDYLFSDVENVFAANASSYGSAHIIQEFTPVSNQLNLNSCAGNATADSLEMLLGQTGKVIQLSRLFIYWNARVYTKDTDKDDGCYIRNCFDSLFTLGVPSEERWAYNESKVFAQPDIFAYGQANDNKINSYYRINGTGTKRLDQIEEAVRSNHPVVFGTGISKQFITYHNQQVVWNIPDNIAGYHAMVITGVRSRGSKREFLIRNSWGDSWGDDNNPGHTWFSEEYMTWAETSDLWVPTLMSFVI